MRTLLAILFILLMSLVLPGCAQKFPGDEESSFVKPNNRIVGKWEITQYTIDGTDRLDSLKAIYHSCWGYIAFADQGYYNYRLHGDSCVLEGHWSYNNRQEEIHLRMGKVNIIAPITQPATGIHYAFIEDIPWSVHQLEKDQFEFYCSFQGTEQRMKGRKIGDF